MNILLVSEVYLPTVSGVASSTDSIARYLVSKGHTVYLVCPNPNRIIDIPSPTGLQIIYTPSIPDPFFYGKTITIIPIGVRKINEIIKTKKIEIAHIQEPGNLGIMTLLLCLKHKIPTVGAMHFSLEQVSLLTPKIVQPLIYQMSKLFVQLIYPRFNGIMVPTQTVADFLQNLIGKAVPIYPVSNGVDTQKFFPMKDYSRLRHKYQISNDYKIFTYIGRLDKDKNIETIISAVLKTDDSVRLIIAGVGKHEAYLKDYATKMNVNNKIIWMGQLNLSQIIEIYQLSDCFIIMSPVETQSIVTLQAIACGLPVIGADAGALPELIHDEANGYLIPTYNVELLANTINEFIKNPQIIMKMSEVSRSISMHHRKSNVLQELDKLYDVVLSNNRKI